MGDLMGLAMRFDEWETENVVRQFAALRGRKS